MGKHAGWFILVAASMVLTLVFWFTSFDQPLIDHHDFRQTQTALSSLYIGGSPKDLVFYETPVLGYPWSIPFEFPLYQWTTTHWHKITGHNLVRSGRLISSLFSIGCVVTSVLLMRLFKIRKDGIYCFLLLYFSSAIYLYWSRSFLIESTALFLTLAAACFYFSLSLSWDQILPLKRIFMVSGLTVSLGLALVTKATTAAPILLLFGLLEVYGIAKTYLQNKDSQKILVQTGSVFLALLISFLMLKAWTFHADSTKSLNPIGIKLTSEALSRWNFGTISQRWSTDLWQETILNRMITPLGTSCIILIGLAIRYKKSNEDAYNLLLISIFLFITPLLLFTNLHIAHSYYQYSNHIFLLLAISASYQLIRENGSKFAHDFSLAAITLFIIGSYGDFRNNYFEMAYRQTSDKLKIGRMINRHTNPDDAIIIFGDDWSSAIAFHSQRYSLTLPKWPSLGISPNQVLENSSSFLGTRRVGAIVATRPIFDKVDQKKLSGVCNNARVRTIKDYWFVYLCRGDS